MIHASDIAGAEKALVAVADQAADLVLVSFLDEIQPKDLLAVMREFDSSREPVVNMLVTPNSFRAPLFWERNTATTLVSENAVIHREVESACEYLEIIAETKGGCAALASCFEDRYDEIFSLYPAAVSRRSFR